MKTSKLVIILVIVSLIALFFVFDLQQYLSLEKLKSEEEKIVAFRNANPISAVIYFCLFYIAFTALSIPGALFLTILGGAIFGLVIGTIIVSFSSAIGATLAFLSSRFLFQDIIESKFGNKLKTINEGLEKDGIFYLFSLRLIPIFPYVLINLLMGLTTIKVWTYYWVTQLGCLIAVVIYINAGTQLSKIQSLKDIASPTLLISLAVMGILPLIIKMVVKKFIKKSGSSAI